MRPSAAIAVASLVATVLAASPVIAGQASSALSKATLDYTVSAATCTLTTPDGTSNVPCDGMQWSLALLPGWSATMSATFDYHYTDDGLPINGWLLGFVGGGVGVRPVGFESAGLYVNSFPACGRASPLCGFLPHVGSLHPVFVSENAVPDDITGSQVINLTAIWPDDSVGAWSGQFGLDNPIVFVNSVPEPSTWALFAVSLAALALVRRRRGSAD